MIRPNFDVSAQMTNESSFTFPFHMHQKILKSEFKKKNKRSKKSRWNISDMCIYICIYMKSVRWTEPTRERNKNSQLPQKKYRRTMKMFQYDRFKLRRIKEPPHRKFLFFFFQYTFFTLLNSSLFGRSHFAMVPLHICTKKIVVYLIAIGYFECIIIIEWFTFFFWSRVTKRSDNLSCDWLDYLIILSVFDVCSPALLSQQHSSFAKVFSFPIFHVRYIFALGRRLSRWINFHIEHIISSLTVEKHSHSQWLNIFIDNDYLKIDNLATYFSIRKGFTTICWMAQPVLTKMIYSFPI